MSCAKVLIQENTNAATRVDVDGRANFESAIPLREYVKTLPAAFAPVEINLEKCIGMDSTFMGVLAMLGLRAYKAKVSVKVINASPANKALLDGLGVSKLYRFETIDLSPAGEATLPAGTAKSDALTTAETVLEAHETLMQADQSNVKRFETVVDFARKDVDKLKK